MANYPSREKVETVRSVQTSIDMSAENTSEYLTGSIKLISLYKLFHYSTPHVHVPLENDKTVACRPT